MPRRRRASLPSAKLAECALEIATDVRRSLASYPSADRSLVRRRLCKLLLDDERRDARSPVDLPHHAGRKRRTRIVLFLGAGASVPHGYPATADLLPAIWHALTSREQAWTRWPGFRRRVNGRYKPRHRNAKELRTVLESVLPGLSPGSKDFGGASIIDVISMLEHSILERHTPIPPPFLRRGAEPGEIEQEIRRGKIIEHPARRLIHARHLLTMAMNGVLKGTKDLPLTTELARWLVESASRPNARVSIVSTNYDTVVESAIYRLLRRTSRRAGAVEEQVDFGFAYRDVDGNLRGRLADAPLAVLKLHGSLNWLRCESCSHVTVNTEQRIASLDSWEIQNHHNSCECGGLLKSLLVTPSIVRDIRDPNLLSVWNAALEDLRLADKWIFVGYSLPAEDVAIRSMLLRAFHTRVQLDDLRVRVVSYESELASVPRSAWDTFRMFFPEAHFTSDDYDAKGLQAFVESLPEPRVRGSPGARKHRVQKP